METMNVVEARKSFSDVMARVAYTGQRVVVERKGRPMMALISIEDLHRLEELERGGTSTHARRAPPWPWPQPPASAFAANAMARPCPTLQARWTGSERSVRMRSQVCVDTSFALKLVLEERQ